MVTFQATIAISFRLPLLTYNSYDTHDFDFSLYLLREATHLPHYFALLYYELRESWMKSEITKDTFSKNFPITRIGEGVLSEYYDRVLQCLHMYLI